MELALYHPRYGYYAGDFEKIGRAGDYYTSSDVHPVFGQLIAKQLKQMWQALGEPDRFTVVEMGAGKGRLGSDILNFLALSEPDFFAKLNYVIVESSPYYKKKQTETFAKHAKKGNVAWCDWKDLVQLKIVGCFLSNELVDSFPVHIITKSKGELREIYVTYRDGQFKEITDAPSSPSVENYLSEFHVKLSEGQRAEINLRALDWLERISENLEKGFVLTIDYGFLADDLYAPWRKNGTLLCYYKHTVNDNPFVNLGYQDMTAHVNFSSLMKKGSELGLQTAGFTTQKNFLLALGFVDLIVEMERKKANSFALLKNKLLMKNLIMPGGMGETFKVLIQHRGVQNPQLIGLRDF